MTNRIPIPLKSLVLCGVQYQFTQSRMSTPSEKTGARITHARKLLGITQEFMAEELSMSQSAYSKLEKGLRKISSDELANICELLKQSPSYILGLDENMAQVNEPGHPYSKSQPKLRLSIEFTEDDAEPDGPLVKRLEEFIKKINAQK